ncbi:MAG: M23 family metallopeptidase [Lachnospiraceae bacterium]|nr:M23 family metallopeptidase [Lachnospiraceae bacterium]
MAKRIRKKHKEHKYIKFQFLKYTMFTIFLCLLFVRGYVPFVNEGDNLFHVKVNGVEVGSVDDPAKAEKMLWDARYQIQSKIEGFTFIEAELETEGEEILWGYVDDEAYVKTNILKVLQDSVQSTLRRSYAVKVKGYLVNLATQEEVEELFQAAIDKYDEAGEFQVKLVHDPKREFTVFTTLVDKREAMEAQEETAENVFEAGAQTLFTTEGKVFEEPKEMDFDDFEYGVLSMDLVENVEVVHAYLPANQVSPVDDAIERLVREQEVPVEYTIVSGDTLSEIALKVNVPMDTIVEMNSDLLDSVNTPIHVGDKLIITVPEPELSVTRREVNYFEEIYDADTIYIENDEWFSNQQVVRQQPSAGFRKISVEENYVNDKVEERIILKQELIKEAVPLIVERGTKVPPTYIKPISGGKLTSGFGKRNRPTAGASTYHQGVDWSTPVGTTVMASCGGTVSKAGWASGYGYCVFIEHEDGKQTRYGHLSKVLVKVGQKVRQGEKIALSGNTGVSTGAHLHFEIRVNGTAVNPLNYVSK